MWAPIICAGIWFGFILYWLTSSIPKDRVYEIYAGCSIGICLTLLLFDLFGWYHRVRIARGCKLCRLPGLFSIGQVLSWFCSLFLRLRAEASRRALWNVPPFSSTEVSSG